MLRRQVVEQEILSSSSSSLLFKCALRESGCKFGYEPTKMNRDHFWRSISRDTNVEISALSPEIMSSGDD